jgi:hypothetical protein
MPAPRSARALAIASTLAIACGPDVTTPLECDRDNPTKLLSVADVEPSEWAISAQTIRDDRGWLVVVEGPGWEYG